MKFLVSSENDIQASTSVTVSLQGMLENGFSFYESESTLPARSFSYAMLKLSRSMYLLDFMQVILFYSKMFDVKISVLPMNLFHFYFSLSASLFSFSFDFPSLSDSVFWRLESGSGSLAVSLFFLFVSAAASFLPFCSFLNTFKY